ncbi:hypothetical protein NPIL_309001 [Nephila pilipes]|uniref:Uncharacterized protein n=1 Tax=Nephila pilipes TaxID=299642 RepID=A0A8X6PHE4_NEPPI|nr:hypothetical protein NPIL_309001 [Nephila pilipes]
MSARPRTSPRARYSRHGTIQAPPTPVNADNVSAVCAIRHRRYSSDQRLPAARRCRTPIRQTNLLLASSPALPKCRPTRRQTVAALVNTARRCHSMPRPTPTIRYGCCRRVASVGTSFSAFR